MGHGGNRFILNPAVGGRDRALDAVGKVDFGVDFSTPRRREGRQPGLTTRLAAAEVFLEPSAKMRRQRSSAVNCSALWVRARKKPAIRRKAAATASRRP